MLCTLCELYMYLHFIHEGRDGFCFLGVFLLVTLAP